MRSTSLIALLLCSMFFGCGGDSSNHPKNLMGFESGLHSINAQSSSDPNVSNFVLVGSLMQSGSSLSGIMHFQGSTCFPLSTDIPVSGTLTETEADFTAMLPNGQRVAFTAMKHPLIPHPQFLGGNYSVSGSGCLANVQALASDGALGFSGSYHGTFVSSTGNTADVTLSLTQAATPDAHGFFTATGSATITGGTCFSSATFDSATVLLGEGTTLVLDDTATGSTGKIVANGTFISVSPVGFPSFGGTYTSTKGSCSETGNLSLH